MMKELEQLCLEIISCAGEARSRCMAALTAAEGSRFGEAYVHLEKAHLKRREAQQIHARLIAQEAGGQLDRISLIAVHSEDIMMGAELTYALAERMVGMYQRFSQA